MRTCGGSIAVQQLFFRLSIHALVAKIQPDEVVWWCRDGDFLHPVFSASRVQHISDLHSKFALRPHHVWNYGRHPVCDCWDQARKKPRKKEETGQKYNVRICYAGRPELACVHAHACTKKERATKGQWKDVSEEQRMVNSQTASTSTELTCSTCCCAIFSISSHNPRDVGKSWTNYTCFGVIKPRGSTAAQSPHDAPEHVKIALSEF